MRLKTWLIASSILIGCASPPPIKPSVILCVLDSPKQEGICSGSQGQSNLFRIPIKDLDKNVCFSPDDWYYIQNYIHYLESIIGK